MKVLIFLLTLCTFIAASAQSSTALLFTKYSDKNGISISTDVASLPEDSAGKVAPSMTIKTMTVENEDEEKKSNRLMKQILRDCSKILNQKDYSVISIDKDDTNSHKVYKYQNGTMTEIFDLEQEEDRLTLTVTQITGLTREAKVSFKIQTSKGVEEISN